MLKYQKTDKKSHSKGYKNKRSSEILNRLKPSNWEKLIVKLSNILAAKQ